MDLAEFLGHTNVKCDQLAAHLDSLDHAGRVSAVAALPRAAQARLFAAVAGYRPLTTDTLVPRALAPLTPVHHVGINNMPMARRFEKVMYRQPSGLLAGYNAQPWQAVTGPGYFTVWQAGTDVVVDYVRLPDVAPPGWPAIRSNARGLSYFVYRGMEDTLRAVSRDVTVGHARRNGRDLPNYFVLVRQDAQARVQPTAQPQQVRSA